MKEIESQFFSDERENNKEAGDCTVKFLVFLIGKKRLIFLVH